MRKCRFLSLAFMMMMLMSAYCISAYAISGYTGELDPETGEPIQEATETSESSNRVDITDNVYYDRDRLGYVYSIGDNAELLCTIVDGLVVQRNVRIDADEGVEITLYQNGTALEDPDLTNIYRQGNYVVEANVSGQSYQVLSFSIIGDVTSNMSGYTMPAGFTITSATLDGEEIYDDSSYVSMVQEGHYVVNYRCARSGQTYELDVTVDMTPPTLTLSGLNSQNQARGPVTISDVEDGASAVIMLDGEQITYRSQLTESGEYQIILTDEAGNVTQYAFTILVYFDLNSLLVIGIAILAIAGVAAYIFLSRKRLAVR